MATNYTKNYNLCQWEPTDAVQRVEFNADNAKLDAALAGLSESRNCQIYTTTYTGTGSGGRTLTFPRKPILVFVMGGIVTFMAAMQGSSYIYLRYGISVSESSATWSGNTLTWSQSEDSAPLSANIAGETYHVVALLDSDT